MPNNLPYRKCIRLSKECYSEPGYPFFVTIRTHNSQSVFLIKDFSDAINAHIVGGPLRDEADLMAYCLMHDHVHFLIAPLKTNIVLLFDRWKSFTTNLLHRKGFNGKLWQRSFYDHALRKEEDIAEVMKYIIYNPVRKGIVEDWKDYPYLWYKGMD